MNINALSLRIGSVLSTTTLLLLALSYNSLLFACPNTNTQLQIINQNSAIKITHSLSIQTTAEGEEIIAAASGTIIN